jgi:hypothetical protein
MHRSAGLRAGDLGSNSRRACDSSLLLNAQTGSGAHPETKAIPGFFPVGWDSSVGIAIRYGLDGPGIESRWRRDFPHPVQTGPGAHPASYIMGTGSFPGVKRPGCGVDHPTPSSAEVKERLEL